MTELEVEADTATRLGAWLLDMGFPQAAPRGHLLTICRGNYHAVWESLMKQVQPRGLVRSQRLQVFAADLIRCRSFEDDLHERIGAVVAPEELEVWRETQSLQKQVAYAELRVAGVKSEVETLAGSVASKWSQRERLSADVCAAKRRQGVLYAATELFNTRADQLTEMARITEQLAPTSPIPQDHNARLAVDRCLSMLNDLSNRRATDKAYEAGQRVVGRFNSTALSDVSVFCEVERPEKDQANNTQDKMIELLEEISASNLWEVLLEKQGQLVRMMAEDATPTPVAVASSEGRAQACLAETSALHCTLALRVLENKRRHAALDESLLQAMRVARVEEEAARELVVLRCEEAALQSRVALLNDELEAMQARRGAYELISLSSSDGTLVDVDTVLAEIASVDRDLIAKKSETEELLISAERTSGKIAIVAAQLEALFRSGRRSLSTGDALPKHEVSVQSNYSEFLQHLRPSMADISTSCGLMDLKEFFHTLPSSDSPSIELSFHLDTSDKSGVDSSGLEGPKTTEEVRLFINRFKIDDNRKLVLNSGESLWISETLERCDPLEYCSPSYAVAIGAVRFNTLHRLTEQKERSLRVRQALGWTTKPHVEINKIVKNGSDRNERTKKAITEYTGSLKQTSSLLDLGLENLAWWAGGGPRNCISEGRTIQGKTYRDYDSMLTDYVKGKMDADLERSRADQRFL